MLQELYRPEFAMLLTGLLLALTVIAGLLTSRIGFPAIVGFLGLGILAGVEGPGGIDFSDYLLTQGVGIVCLAFILFSGGLDTNWRAVRPMLGPALALATLGVGITAGVVALAGILLLDFAPLQAFLLGAVVASTDAAAVFSVLRSSDLDLKDDVPALLELESGSNDPMAIFLVTALLAFTSAAAPAPLSLLPDFIQQMLVGAGVGLVAGYALPEGLKRMGLRQGGLAFVVSIAGALLAFGFASLLGGNGFLAVYVAGVYAGTRAFAAKPIVRTFQDGLAWLAQVVMFLTLGLLLTPSNLLPIMGEGIAITVVLILVARPLAVFGCLLPFRRFDTRTMLFVSWAGLRGAVPIVLAIFPMVAGIEGAFTIFNVVFFVVLVSSVVQGPSINRVAKWLHIGERRPAD
ncbi:potassium/proton antiporter [Aurantiacibacter rhizosphaerae]|uniref:Potassium/proton antiporter n=1 Tax=Aurantiacibacter rhizosphaerae TaxID=2691582 RepID=A0A844XBA4_9SPHN|nr:potassium/proton antiporter [Aurantiacibacter rhizosphaerae]MWV27059.1 potassium/proton antiporter [Aurantiacibacter rhizosphaerae]